MIDDIFCRECKNCGREITILHPTQWAYKRANGHGYWYWCSWKCLRETERKEENMEQKLSKEQKQKAVEIAISGGNPLEYIRECGSDAPGKLWYAIKGQLKKNDPETYAKIPARLQPVKAQKIEVPEGTLADAVAGMTDAADTFFGACKDMGLKLETPTVKVDGPLKIETPEAKKIEIVETPEAARVKKKVIDIMEDLKIRNPLRYEDFTVRCVEGQYGSYYRDVTRNGDYIDFSNKEGDELSMTVGHWKEFIKELKRAALVLGVELE